MALTREEHIKKHKELHDALVELAADFISHTSYMLSETSVIELMEWSCKQTSNPTEKQRRNETK